MNSTEVELLQLIKDFVAESRIDRKEVSVCLTELKKRLSEGDVRMTKIESLCQTSKDLRVTCTTIHEDVEKRLRAVEEITSRWKIYPKILKN